ncbi:MAG TPA: TonB-dependent receptor [Steroidobacteraceae bacterium]|nr:TonB-dependent receptor [Steroidobacteraceae bacterium]
MAQDTADQGSIGAVVVTGSRIARPDLDSASPVSIISSEQIAETGIQDMGQLIQRMPSMSGSPIGTTTNNGGDGSVQVDLRGMGVDRTLTLVNGKRTVDGGDYQTIPAVMIERVEVLKDGGASVYGADAVAGVVNIITRKDFEGLELGLQTADFFDMDSGRQQTFSLIGGKTFDSGHFVFGAEYVDQEEAYQSDAPWDFFQNSYYIYPEGCERQVAAPYDGTPTGGCYPIGSSRIPEGFFVFPTHGILMGGAGGLQPWDGRTYNYAPVNYIQTPYERTNVFADGKYALTDSVNFTASMRGNFRKSAQELAPTPYTTEPGADPAHEFTLGGTTWNGIHPDNFYLSQALAAAGLAPEPALQLRRRMVETSRRFSQDITQFQVHAGVDGSFENGMSFDVYYNWGYRSRKDRDTGQLFGPRLHAALGPSADLDGDGSPECYGDIGNPATLIPGCVPLNVIGGPGTITQEMLDYVGIDFLNDSFETRQHEAVASLAGTAFSLPGGKLGWAAGLAYTRNAFTYTPDSAKSLGVATGNIGAGTNGRLEAQSVFGEVFAPVFDNGTQSFDLKAGVRYDDYTDITSEVTYAVGLEFHVSGDLKLRGTYGTVFRAPTISDLFAGQFDSFPTYVDPCAQLPLPPGCPQQSVQFDSQVLAKLGGNPFLEPETGETFTAGLVWTPAIGPGQLTATLDYWDIQIEDGISSLGVQFILNDCYINQNASSCALVTRNNDANFTINQIIDGSLNVAEQGANGVDLELRYNWDTNLGSFEAGMLWVHLLDRTKVPFPGADEDDLSGRYTDVTAQDGGGYADDKINYTFRWRRGDLTLAYLGEYISALDADTFCNCGAGNQPDGSYIQSIGSQLYHDLVANYELPTGTTIAAGLTNITDEPPPYIEIGFNATTEPSNYRMFGRGYYLRLTHRFR